MLSARPAGCDADDLKFRVSAAGKMMGGSGRRTWQDLHQLVRETAGKGRSGQVKTGGTLVGHRCREALAQGQSGAGLTGAQAWNGGKADRLIVLLVLRRVLKSSARADDI